MRRGKEKAMSSCHTCNRVQALVQYTGSHNRHLLCARCAFQSHVQFLKVALLGACQHAHLTGKQAVFESCLSGAPKEENMLALPQ